MAELLRAGERHTTRASTTWDIAEVSSRTCCQASSSGLNLCFSVDRDAGSEDRMVSFSENPYAFPEIVLHTLLRKYRA